MEKPYLVIEGGLLCLSPGNSGVPHGRCFPEGQDGRQNVCLFVAGYAGVKIFGKAERRRNEQRNFAGCMMGAQVVFQIGDKGPVPGKNEKGAWHCLSLQYLYLYLYLSVFLHLSGISPAGRASAWPGQSLPRPAGRNGPWDR